MYGRHDKFPGVLSIGRRHYRPFKLLETAIPHTYKPDVVKAFFYWEVDADEMEQTYDTHGKRAEETLESRAIAVAPIATNPRNWDWAHKQRFALLLMAHVVELAALAHDACQMVENSGIRDPDDSKKQHPLVVAFNDVAETVGLPPISGPNDEPLGWQRQRAKELRERELEERRKGPPAPVIPIKRDKDKDKDSDK